MNRVVVGMGLTVAVIVGATVGAMALVRASSSAGVDPITDQAERDAVGAKALALVGFDAGRVGYAIRFAPGKAGIRAQADRSAKEVRVFLRHGDTPNVIAHDIAHELGHAYDQTRMSDADRAAYLQRRGVPAAAWMTSDASDYATGAGDFAEVFALCHAASPDFRSELAPRPADACALLPDGAL